MYLELKAGSYFLNNSTKSPLTGKFVPVQSLKTEDRRQKTEDRRQKTEDRRQKTEDRRQKTEDSGVESLSGTINFSGAQRPTGSPFSGGFPAVRIPFKYPCRGRSHSIVRERPTA